MPKPQTYSTLFDDLKTVSVTLLKKNQYLKPNQSQRGTITWSTNGISNSSISILVNTVSESPYLELNYKCNETPINYRVQLITAPSNLGKGVVWYFVCPSTGKRCRKLHLADTFFYHRSAFRGCLYEKQTLSKKSRYLDKSIGLYFRKIHLLEQLDKKHFKKQYAGKSTSKFLKLTQQLERAKCISFREIEKAILN